MNTSLKTCFKCGCEKPLAGFYRHKQMKDGHLNKCKECTKLDVMARYISHEGRSKIVEYERKRAQNPDRKRKAIGYQITRRKRDPMKMKARQAIGNAIRSGSIKRLPCEVCGDPKSQAHHVDYAHPLSVRWFCFKHHREIGHGQKVGI